MPGFAGVYAQKRGVDNARLLEDAVLDTHVKPKLVSMMRRVHAAGKPLKVTLLGGGPCLETAVIMQLVEDLQLEPELKVNFVNCDNVTDWQAGHSALSLTVPVATCPDNLKEMSEDIDFWKALGQLPSDLLCQVMYAKFRTPFTQWCMCLLQFTAH